MSKRFEHKSVPTGRQVCEAQVIRLLEELNGRGVTLIIVTHDQKLGSRARRQLWMEDGQLRHDHRASDRPDSSEVPAATVRP